MSRQQTPSHDDALRIHLEGRLEVVEALLRRWEQASDELQPEALPRAQTVAALRAAELTSREALEHTQRREEPRQTIAALERAREHWAQMVRTRLTRSGVVLKAARAREVLDEVAALGPIEVLDVFMSPPEPPPFGGAVRSFLWVGCLGALALGLLGGLDPVFKTASGVWLVGVGSATVGLGYVRLGVWAFRVQRARRAHAALNGLTLFCPEQAPLELSRVIAVAWAGATPGPTELAFHLADGGRVTRTFIGDVEALLARLRALGVKVLPVRG
jgi:hypothetical protein